MSRQLTTPIPRPEITRQAIRRISIHLEHNPDGAIDPTTSFLGYQVVHCTEDGSVITQIDRRVYISAMPNAIKADLKTLYQRCLAHAENSGAIAPGTDEDGL